MWVVSRSAVLVSFFLAAVLPRIAMGEVPGENLLEIQPGKTGTDIRLDRAAIETLPQIDFQTTTIWTDGTHHFSGPSLLSVLRAAGIVDGVVSLRAANDYSVEIPVAELTENAPIIEPESTENPLTCVKRGRSGWFIPTIPRRITKAKRCIRAVCGSLSPYPGAKGESLPCLIGPGGTHAG